MIDAPPGDRGCGQDRLGVLRDDRDPREEHLLEGRGQAATAGGVLACGEELLGEERIPVRPGVDASDEAVVGTPAEDGGEELRTPAASRRARSILVTSPVRSSSASHGSRDVAGEPSERKVSSSSTRCDRRPRARNATVSRVAGSAQWRSSTTTTTGVRPASRWSSPSSASRTRTCSHCCCTGPATVTGDSAGTSRTRSGADGPTTAASSSGVQLLGELPQDLHDRRVRESTFTDVRARTTQDQHAPLLRDGGDVTHVPALAYPRLPGDQQVAGSAIDGGVDGTRRDLELRRAPDGDGTDRGARACPRS